MAYPMTDIRNDLEKPKKFINASNSDTLMISEFAMRKYDVASAFRIKQFELLPRLKSLYKNIYNSFEELMTYANTNNVAIYGDNKISEFEIVKEIKQYLNAYCKAYDNSLSPDREITSGNERSLQMTTHYEKCFPKYDDLKDKYNEKQKNMNTAANTYVSRTYDWNDYYTTPIPIDEAYNKCPKEGWWKNSAYGFKQ